MFFKQILQEKIPEKIVKISPLSGGDINDVYKINTSKNSYVLKVNRKEWFPTMFEKEKLGLQTLAETGIKTPKVVLCFLEKGHQFLLLEFIEEEKETSCFWGSFAKDLVKIHQTNNNYFGFKHDNYIGSLKQNNTQKQSWESFYVACRISPLVKQAFDKKLIGKHHLNAFDNFFKNLNEILPKEKPSLLHGDLWSGNLMKGINQTPIFIDPAIYFGNREMDIAMTQLFGGFDNRYLTHYNEIFPMEKGWENRIEIHNLYPNLVHLILFGKSYLRSIESVIQKF